MKILVATAATVIMSGCASSGTQVQDTSLTQFQKGITTQADVIKALGPPQVQTTESDGTRSIAYVYTHAQAKAKSFIPVVGLFAGGATGQSSMTRFHFGKDGKLESYETSSSTTDVDTGIAGGRSSTSETNTAK